MFLLKYFYKFACILFILFIFGCNNNPGITPGKAYPFQTNGVSFNLIHVPSLSYPKGIKNDQKIKVENSFLIGQTEVTNDLASVVFQWAYENNRFNSNPDSHNFLNSKIAKYGSRRLLDLSSEYCQIVFKNKRFSVKKGFKNYPVVEITWFGAIMICNWLTEMIDEKNNIVYRGISKKWEADDTIHDKSKSGFRLPTYDEWELAAKYIDGKLWLPGSHASGDISSLCYDYDNPGGNKESVKVTNFAWFGENSRNKPNSGFASNKGTHPIATAGSTSGIPFSGNPNHLEIFDMSGNVWEWTFTKFQFMRYIKGGCWYRSRKFIQSGKSENYRPEYDGTLVGFRLVKNISK